MTSYQGVSTNYVMPVKMERNAKKIKIIICRCFLMILSSFILYFILKIIKKNIF
jgi:hypothetical protein